MRQSSATQSDRILGAVVVVVDVRMQLWELRGPSYVVVPGRGSLVGTVGGLQITGSLVAGGSGGC